MLPHTRGYTAYSTTVGAAVLLAPAHAGLHRWRRSSMLAGPCSCTGGATPTGVSRACSPWPLLPHTRGYTASGGLQLQQVELAPAHAGLHRPPRERSQGCDPCSRTRGATPSPSILMQARGTLLPHTRGYTAGTWDEGNKSHLAPAHARLHRRARKTLGAPSACSRTRGATPASRSRPPWTSSLLPHTPGYTASRSVSCSGGMLAPAHAGLHRSSPRPTGVPCACSRTRGATPSIG